MPQPRPTLARVIIAAFVIGGAVVDALAVAALVRDPASDAAWVAVPLGVLLVVWGVAFARIPDDEPGDEQAGDAVSARDGIGAGGRAPLVRLSEVIAVLAVYVLLRTFGRPLDTALVGVVGAIALRVFSLWADRLVRRRQQRDEGVGPATD